MFRSSSHPRAIAFLIGLCATAFLSQSTHAQLINSIGGVENWFRADAGVTSDANGVATWADQKIGVADNATRVSTIGPTVVNSAALNNQPVLRFTDSATTDDLSFSGVSHGSTNDFSFLAVVDASGNLNSQIGFFLGSNVGGGSGDTTKIGLWNNGGGEFFRRIGNGGGGSNDTPWPGTDGAEVDPRIVYLQRNTGNTLASAFDGGALAGAVTENRTSRIQRIGGPENSASSQNFPGDIAELVFFGDTLNSAERTLATNYLSAKYNLPLSGPNVYSGDDPLNGNYDQGVFGVGQASDGTSLASSNDGGVTLTATGSLDNGEFVMAGHKVGANMIVPATVAGFEGDQWLREFFLDTNGGDVDLDLVFDLTEFPPNLDDEFALLFKENEGAPFEILDIAANFNGVDTVTFSFNTLADLPTTTGVFTLGINVTAVPEPASIALWSLLGLAVCGFAWRQKKV